LDLRSVFNRLFLLSGLILMAAGCADIARDNPLDPRNKDSRQMQTVLIEAFVNTANTQNYNEMMLAALDSLQRRHPQKLQMAVYHRNTPDFPDALHINESELQYQRYLTALGATDKGTPDLFINGIHQRVQGASSVNTALLRLEAALANALNADGYYSIETDINRSGNQLDTEVTLARLGSHNGRDLRVKAMLIANLGAPHSQHTVTAVTRSAAISRLNAGEQITRALNGLVLEHAAPHRLLILVTDENESTVYQCSMFSL